MHECGNGLGVEGYGNGHVAIAATGVVGVDGAEHAVTIAAAVVVARCTILRIGVFPTWIVHEIALADVDASRVERVIVFAAADVVVVVNGAGLAAAVAGVGGVCGAAEVAEVGAIGIVACLLASDVVVAAVVAMAGLYLRLCAWVHIAISGAWKTP